MDHVPGLIVVKEQTFEIGDIYVTSFARIDVEVNVIGMILLGQVVTQEWNTLGEGSEKGEVKSEKYQQSLHGFTSFPSLVNDS
jgi:hypothetical protein